MRLWHYQLIESLSRQHLLGQWRECLAITGAIAKHGAVNHATVNRLNDFAMAHLIVYIELVRAEMTKRGYRTSEKSRQKLVQDIGYDWQQPLTYHKDKLGKVILPNGEGLFASFHNERYLMQNLYMMQEKADTGQIEQEVWQKMIDQLLPAYPTLENLR
ncbi:pyrimidine dimer DNA glycosylase/endonuclease V [Fructobacillus parabroussonetiae]|uniref:Uncharacterized protein n=1 Tax=Fructobacillus parabroussonetiae TaxID=2713174 RepID=A0ABS5QV34_9LACO|nr:pyrimidine dimer DNA glycosylase/endonuclease V [Fructobacillus parabroussonetiae]MBS9337054.1 hypothetical protein [Fructobacillus parabroussonetiae]MCK8617574.1 pyrimidine dimer DNA glycosylase/endonuclease V [Fructobacillus parabroussonetiae]